MSVQLAPPLSQRCHCSASVGTGLPDQTPAVTVSVCPCWAVPDSVGGD